MSEAILSENVMPSAQPTEEDALRLLDEAREALDEIKEMKLESFIKPENALTDDTIDLEIVHTSSDADIIELSQMIIDALPHDKEEKTFSKMSNSDKNPNLGPDTTAPVPAINLDFTPGHITTATETSQPTQDLRKRWAALRRIFSRNKTNNKI